MDRLKIFIDLTRLNKPTGFMLLFWPCSWGLAFAQNHNGLSSLFYYYLILFFFGSLLMRSAGCIFNDIVDKDFDKKVERTKLRPIAAGKISVAMSFFYVIILCLLALLILLQFNLLTIMLGMSSMVLAFAYPFMKRITYWPQLFLGLTFNWGIIMAYSALNNEVTAEVLILYLMAIFWTLGYDTIYGTQDISDDEIIGLKSTSIKFKNNIKKFVTMNYLIAFLISVTLLNNFIGFNYFTFFLIFFGISLSYQIFKFDRKDPLSCFKAFKINNISGLLFFLALFSTSI